jgi:hypothetical protein
LSTQGTLCGFVSLTDLFQHSELTASIFAPWVVPWTIFIILVAPRSLRSWIDTWHVKFLFVWEPCFYLFELWQHRWHCRSFLEWIAEQRSCGNDRSLISGTGVPSSEEGLSTSFWVMDGQEQVDTSPHPAWLRQELQRREFLGGTGGG